MKILLTGGSSFTGYWFARGLAAAGHEVTATFRAAGDGAYEGMRGRRTAALGALCRRVFDCTFGAERFRALVASEGPWDVFCHHAADTAGYNRPGFDVQGAVARNTRGLEPVLDDLAAGGCRRLVLTGSVFERDEGAGGADLRAFSPYGLSKSLTSDAFRRHAAARGLTLGKFVIPNPFGPFEEPRFTTYLAREWFAGRVPCVRTPRYVRDNIHVDLLASAYVGFVTRLPGEGGFRHCGPGQYRETQGDFARRCARALAPRLGIPCPVDQAEQTDFAEPMERVNTDALDARDYAWSEARAWDGLAAFYREVYGGGRPA